jgi:hypothetical protein
MFNKTNFCVHNHISNYQLDYYESGSIHTNLGSTGNIDILLPAPLDPVIPGSNFIFSVEEDSYRLRISCDVDHVIKDDLNPDFEKNTFIYATKKGSYVELIENNNGDWLVVSKAGDWKIGKWGLNKVGETDAESTVNKIWGDGTYLYIGKSNSDFTSTSLKPYVFNGSSFIGSAPLDNNYSGGEIWGDGTYIYSAMYDSIYDPVGYGLIAHKKDGNEFNFIDGVPTTDGYFYGVGGDGNYIYTTDETTLYAFTFDGNNFCSFEDAIKINLSIPIYEVNYRQILCVDNYIIVSSAVNLEIYVMSGGSLSREYIYTPSTNGHIDDISRDPVSGNYYYISTFRDGLFASELFTNPLRIETITGVLGDIGGGTSSVWSDGAYVYALQSNTLDSNTLKALSFDGSSFTVDWDSGKQMKVLWGDGTYLYILNYGTSKIEVYTYNGTMPVIV